jgi:hypothetical protein
MLATGFSGCGTDGSQYSYIGKIDKEYVIFEEDKSVLGYDQNILTVIKSDDKIIRYRDIYDDDFKIDSVEIIEGNGKTIYNNQSEIGKLILSNAQKQFDNYLQQIKEHKTNQELMQGLKSLE